MFKISRNNRLNDLKICKLFFYIMTFYKKYRNDCSSVEKMFDEKKFDAILELTKKMPQTYRVLHFTAACLKNTETIENLIKSIEIYEMIINKKVPNDDLIRKIYSHEKKNNLTFTNPEFFKICENAYVDAISILSNAHLEINNIDEVFEYLHRGLLLCQKNWILVYNTGHFYKKIGKFDEAVNYLCKSLELNCKHNDTYIELINIYRDKHDRENTKKYIDMGLRHIPNSSSLYNFLGLYYEKVEPIKAIEAYKKGIECSTNKEDKSQIIGNMGHILSQNGQTAQSLKMYLDAYKENNDDVVPLQNYTMDSLYLSDVDYKTVLKRHFDVGMALVKKHKNNSFTSRKYNHKKLRIGYVSNDFFTNHPVTYFIKHILNDYDEEKFIVYCYSISNISEISNYNKNIIWKNIKYLTTTSCLNMIRNDEIDILIDLSGHTEGNRMDIFSNRIAHLQLSYVGYPCITGLPDVDFHIIDKTFMFNTPKTINLPHCFTHYSVPMIPENLIQPYHNNGYLTFGTLNKASKINDKVIELYDRILDAYPNACLIIRKMDGKNFKNMDRIIQLDLVQSLEEHLNKYNLIDIALDTFPYSGTTTTCESLLMGVPVVTLFDNVSHAIHQNTTPSILINSDLGEYVSESYNEYLFVIQKAFRTIKYNKNLKYDVRRKFLNGYVTNKKIFVDDYEKLLLDTYNNKK